jgi:hypothetical protein
MRKDENIVEELFLMGTYHLEVVTRLGSEVTVVGVPNPRSDAALPDALCMRN